MLARTTKQEPQALASERYVAEPKLDGIRAGLAVEDHRLVAAYSRTGRSILGEKGLAWLKDVRWPMRQAYLDAEAYAGDGTSQGALVASEAKTLSWGALSIALFDLLAIDGHDVMLEPWSARRQGLEAHFGEARIPRITLVPVTDDWWVMWDSWVGRFRGEGVMLKERTSTYQPGKRSPAWIKVKAEHEVDVVITGVTAKATYSRTGYRTGEVSLTYGYSDGNGGFTTVGQGIIVGARAELEKHVGKVAKMLCAGTMPSGALRHHRLIAFRDDKGPEECLAA